MAGCLFPVDQPLRSAKRRNSKERDVVSCLYDFDFLQRNLDNTTISPFIMVFPSNGELSFPWNLLLCGLAYVSLGLRPPDHRLRRFWRRAWEQDECRDNLGGPAKEKDRREAGPTTGELSRIPWDLVLNRLMSGLSQPCRYKKERSDCKVRTHHALASQTISLIKRNRGLWARAKAPLWAVRILLVTKKSGNQPNFLLDTAYDWKFIR